MTDNLDTSRRSLELEGLNLEYRMLTERRTESARAERRRIMKEEGRDYSGRRDKQLVPRTDGLVQALNTRLTMDHYVLATPKSINTQLKFTKGILMNTKHMATSQQLTLIPCPTSTVLSADFLAKLFQSLGDAEALTIPEGRSSLTLREYCEQNNLDYSSLKMLKDFSATTTEILSKPSSLRLRSWGMTSNGKCLTARITESPKIASGLSLSDILETHPDPKYFLSEKMTDYIMRQMRQTDHNHKPNLVQR